VGNNENILMTVSSQYTLVVDLDGTLLKSDMLHESFWSAFAQNIRTPFTCMLKLLMGRAVLKRYLHQVSSVEINTLPMNTVVLDYIRAHKNAGGKVVLVTASDQLFADEIAEYIGLFDEVYGSDGNVNLKGNEKAQFLQKLYGQDQFIYVGDSAADLAIWKIAAVVVTVEAKASLQRRVEGLGKPTHHLIHSKQIIRPTLKALRPHQWLKNILVFMPMMAAHKLDYSSLLSGVHAFITVCFIASSVYLLNDLLDLKSDRVHPRKKMRPFASGALSLFHGSLLMMILLFLGFVSAAFLGWIFLFTICVYYLLTLAYSLILKRKIIIDICVLAVLYTIRIIAGGVVTGTELSLWLLTFSMFFFLSLASVKRQAELIDLINKNQQRVVGRGYDVQDLPIISIISLTSGYISVLVMALYISSPDILMLYQTPQILWGICCVLLYWLSRMVIIANRGMMHDDPVVYASTDKISLICFFTISGLGILGALF
jgi:HAD superfamily hydrolase (TIGR01549 family)